MAVDLPSTSLLVPSFLLLSVTVLTRLLTGILILQKGPQNGPFAHYIVLISLAFSLQASGFQ